MDKSNLAMGSFSFAVVCGMAACSGYNGGDLFSPWDGGARTTGGTAGLATSGGGAGTKIPTGGGSGGADGGNTTGSDAGGGVGGAATGGSAGLDAGTEIGPAFGDAGMDAPPTPTMDAGTDANSSCTNPVLCRLRAILLHRYSFQGTGTIVTDSVGAAHGKAVNVQLVGTGTLELVAGADQYVALPSGVIRNLRDATFEVWLTWNGANSWERVFDFGDNDQSFGPRGTALSTFFLSPFATTPRDGRLAVFKRSDQSLDNELRIMADGPLARTRLVQLAVAVDETHSEMRLYQDGSLLETTAFFDSLSDLNDANNWLGRSQYWYDPSFSGTFYDFRIYGAALTQADLHETFLAGPDASF